MQPCENEQYTVDWNGEERHVMVKVIKRVLDRLEEESTMTLEEAQQEAYSRFAEEDPRLDERSAVSPFLPASEKLPPDTGSETAPPEASTSKVAYDGKNEDGPNGKATSGVKRKREHDAEPAVPTLAPKEDNPTNSQQPRTVSFVLFGSYEIKCWYSSPYPLDEPTNISVPASSKGKQTAGPALAAILAREPDQLDVAAPAYETLVQPASLPTSDKTASIATTRRKATAPQHFARNHHGRFAKGGGAGKAKGRTRGRLPNRAVGRPPAQSGSITKNELQNEYAPTVAAIASDSSLSAAMRPSTSTTASQAGPSASEDGNDIAVPADMSAHAHNGSNSPGPDSFDLSSYSMDTYAPPLRLNGGASEGAMLENDNPYPSSQIDDGDLTDSTEADDSMQAEYRSDSLSTEESGQPQASIPRDSPDRPVLGGSASTAEMETRTLGAPASNGKKEKPSGPVKLHVCEGCFKYMQHPPSYGLHTRTCTTNRPPGKAVYQRGVHTIWEVDGESAKLYCQNLCLFGKLFIDHKYVFFETSGFLFYVLTEARPKFDHPLGFFSKEKISYNDYNLACIVTFPPYQKRGFGSLMIEFSYELSRRSSYSRRAGTPERPLSDLGLRGYLQFWTSVLIRYFRLIFYTRNDPRLVVLSQLSNADKKEAKPKKNRHLGWQGEVEKGDIESEALLNKACETPATASASAAIVHEPSGETPALSAAEFEAPESDSQNEPEAKKAVEAEAFEMRFSLAEIANATHLREDDVAFAMVHSGLANYRTRATESTPDGESPQSETELELVLAPSMVEEVATKLKIKPPVMSRTHCLL